MYALKQMLPWLFIAAGLLGLLASGMLTIEFIAQLQNPEYIPPCNVSPFVSCSSVLQTWQSHILGFPNSLVGVGGFSIIMTIGFALLAGAEFRRWFWIGVQTGVTLALLCVFWFFFQSVFVLRSLCPWCLLFWAVTIPLFSYVTVYNLREKHVVLPSAFTQVNTCIAQNPHAFLLVLYGIIFVIILIKFSPYWTTFL